MSQAATGLRVQIASYNANLQGAETSRHDLTPWLIPVAEQTPLNPVSAAPISNEKRLKADVYKSKNANTLSTHPSLPREAPDFLAVGFQELLPLHTGMSAAGGAALYNTDLDIRKTIRPMQAVVSGNGMYASLDEGGGPEGYPLLCSVNIGGIALFVYARERAPFSINKSAKDIKGAAHRVKEIRIANVGAGLGSVMSNKGAVGARVVVAAADAKGPDEVLTFVSAHLAAHDHNVPRRNQDWQQIVQRMIFEPTAIQKLPIMQDADMAVDPKNLDALQRQHAQATQGREARKTTALDEKSYSIYDTTHLFVFGDLNYRIALGESELKQTKAGPLTKDTLYEALGNGDWTRLAAHDQLSYQRLADPPRAFHGLTEVPIAEAAIPPTYKYTVEREGKKSKAKKGVTTSKALEGQSLTNKRIPGWTDRILWASAPGQKKGTQQGVEVEFYRSIMHYTHSDHKPITTLLRLPPPSGSDIAMLSSANPFDALPAWHRYSLATGGVIADRAVGYTWTLLLLVGGGSLAGGLIEVFIVGVITAWWFSHSPSSV